VGFWFRSNYIGDFQIPEPSEPEKTTKEGYFGVDIALNWIDIFLATKKTNTDDQLRIDITQDRSCFKFNFSFEFFFSSIRSN